jgi:hypothetical protein
MTRLRGSNDAPPPPTEKVVMTDFEQRYLPDSGSPPPGAATCAIVGNSRSLLTQERGAEIDEHDVVLRLNQAGLLLRIHTRPTCRVLTLV